ncbi:MAG: hypothetical protein ACFCU4_06725 [Puniceicoccaceae bacterium]
MPNDKLIDLARFEAETEEATRGVELAFAFVRSVIYGFGFLVLGCWLGFLVGLTITPWHSLAYFVGMAYGFSRSIKDVEEDLIGWPQILALSSVNLLLLAAGIATSSQVVDLSREGLSRDAETVYLLAHGWNPARGNDYSLPARGAVGPTAEMKVYFAEGNFASSGAVVGAVIASVLGDTQVGKGYQWLLMGAGGVFLVAFLLLAQVRFSYALLIGVAYLIGSPFVIAWASFAPMVDYVAYLVFLGCGIYGIRSNGSEHWSDLLPWVFGLSFLVSPFGWATVVAGGLAIAARAGSDPERGRWIRLKWIILGLGMLGLLVLGALNEGVKIEPERLLERTRDVLSAPVRDQSAPLLSPSGPWSSHTSIAEGMLERGTYGPFFAVILGLGCFLILRCWFLQRKIPVEDGWMIGWLALSLLVITDLRLSAMLLGFFIPYAMIGTLRSERGLLVDQNFTRMVNPSFIDLGKEGGTAKALACSTMFLFMIQGVIGGFLGAIAHNRAQLRFEDFLVMPDWRSSSVLVSQGEAVGIYEILEQQSVLFQLSELESEIGLVVPFSDIRIDKLYRIDQSLGGEAEN